MKHQPILFPKKILFVEFLVRDYRFNGKGTVRTTLPHDAFFYTGPSKAGYSTSSSIGFDSGKVFVSDELPDAIISKVFKENTNIVCSIADEALHNDNTWTRHPNRLSSNKTGFNGNQGQLPYANFKSIAPYGFNITDIDENGTLITDFPRANIYHSIETNQTLCFLCRREERGDMDWYTPNVNLVLFVKNHGLHDRVDFLPQQDIDRIVNNNQLSSGKWSLRDFRKSCLNFELG
ncbi:hypothetical protein D0T84_21350 [Dysgonomonas sp. 521]|uniref:hypothetical protein n=1 Tax=Dysgonomonas sp. 521 TaxID=2302932 RepID=UPI0013D0C0F6|nr:hypothetical protein [Dysgonomonas sp. 521]NDV97423.1 hypothetical protein [Dysgonomonas sp. 521]